MAKFRTLAAVLLAAGSASCGVEAWAADAVPTGASAATAASAPKACIDGWSFIATNCQLTWQGIMVFGIVDTGVGWQSHNASASGRAAQCFINPYFASAQAPAGYWRHRRVY